MAKNLIIRITCSLVFSVTALLPGLAQDQECGVLVSPRVEDGHAYYEVVATGFPADAEVQFSWWRREGTQTQNTQYVQRQDTQSADVAVTQEFARVGLCCDVLQ